MQICSNINKLVSLIGRCSVMVFDFETSGLNTRTAHVVSCGLYFPEADKIFYINTGHTVINPDFPLYSPEDLMDALRQFVGCGRNILIAHNATFDLQFLLRYGLSINCHVSDSMVWAHRMDENYCEHGHTVTRNSNCSKMGYGLKKLTTILFNERAPVFHEAAGTNALFSDPYHVGVYCAHDVKNTWNIYSYCDSVLQSDPVLYQLVRDLDDAVNVPLAKMLYNGFYVDPVFISQASENCTDTMLDCEEHIRKLTDTQCSLSKPAEILSFLRTAQWPEDCNFDQVFEQGCKDLRRDMLLEIYPEAGCVQKLVLAALMMKSLAKARLEMIFRPLRGGASLRQFSKFYSITDSTRYSCSPNLHGLPGKSDKHAIPADVIECLPEDCRYSDKTRDLLIAPEGYKIVAFDLKAAEPRYAAIHFQNVLRERDRNIWPECIVLRNKYRAAFTFLYDLMRATKEPYTGDRVEYDWARLSSDPLYEVFMRGEDPYSALLKSMMPNEYAASVNNGTDAQWLADNRTVGKFGHLALTYGSSPASLASKLGWTLEQGIQAVENLYASYPVLQDAKELVQRRLVYMGMVRNLWGRPRRINAYYHILNTIEPLYVGFSRAAGDGTRINYEAEIIVLGAFRQGVQCFCRKVVAIHPVRRGEYRRRIVLEADDQGHVLRRDVFDPFVSADHFNKVPFRNLSYRSLKWVRTSDGCYHYFPRQESALRIAFNAIFQSTGADHLRWIIRNVDREILPQFPNSWLFMTVHDSLEYYVPNDQVDSFIRAALPVIERRPSFSNGLDFEVECEVGQRFGSMTPIP